MSDYAELLFETVDHYLRAKCTPEVVAAAERYGWAPDLWAELEALELTRIGVEGSREDALGVVRLAGRYAAPVPLAETILASLLEPKLPEGPATVAAGGRAAYGRCATYIVGVGPYELVPDVNYAGEPWDRVHPAGLDAMLLEGALVRSVQIVGALEAVLELTSAYAQDRAQFGRPLSAFQAVQRHLARLAGETLEATAVTDRAIRRPDEITVAVAKVRCGMAAGRVAGIAHQIHGAMGMTQEYRLQQFTRRLWSWRNDFGSETEWAIRLGHRVTELGADAAWDAVA